MSIATLLTPRTVPRVAAYGITVNELSRSFLSDSNLAVVQADFSRKSQIVDIQYNLIYDGVGYYSILGREPTVTLRSINRNSPNVKPEHLYRQDFDEVERVVAAKLKGELGDRNDFAVDLRTLNEFWSVREMSLKTHLTKREITDLLQSTDLKARKAVIPFVSWHNLPRDDYLRQLVETSTFRGPLDRYRVP